MGHQFDTELCLKILSCHGNVNARSAAKMCNTSRQQVYTVWNFHGLACINKNKGKHGY